MKIPESAFPQIIKMVTQSLPYETPFEPITPEAKTIVSILRAITDRDTNLKDVEGFIYHLAATIDERPATQESTKRLLQNLKSILDEYTNEIE